MTDEIGTTVARTSRGAPISMGANAKPSRTDTTTDADEREDELEALRKRLTRPITAARFSEIARGGPSAVIDAFFSDEAESN